MGAPSGWQRRRLRAGVSDLTVRIEAAQRAAASARSTADTATGTDAAAALQALQTGLWPALRIYIDARTEGVRLTAEEQAALDAAINDWLMVYAAHYGREISPSVPVRSVAETFLDTHDLQATAEILTGIPDSSAGTGGQA